MWRVAHAEDLVMAAAGSFGSVHGGIGVVDELLWIGGVVAGEGDNDAGGSFDLDVQQDER